MEQNNNTNEKCFISELNSLVEKESVDYAHQYICTETKMITPIGYMLTPVKRALDMLYDLASRLCENIGQIELDDKHEWEGVSIKYRNMVRKVYYTAVITDGELLSALHPIYAHGIFLHERAFIKTYLNRCLLRLNDVDAELTWAVASVAYRVGEDRLILTLIAKRKDKDNAID